MENKWEDDTQVKLAETYWVYNTDSQGEKFISGLAALVSKYDDGNDHTMYYAVTGTLVPGWVGVFNEATNAQNITDLKTMDSDAEAKSYMETYFNTIEGISVEAASYDTADSDEDEAPSSTTQSGLAIPAQSVYDDAVNEALSTFKERQREDAEVKYAKWVYEYNEDKDTDGNPGAEDTDLAGLALIFHAKAENGNTYYYILKTVPMRDGWDGILERNNDDLILNYKDYYDNYEEAEKAMNDYIAQYMTMTENALN